MKRWKRFRMRKAGEERHASGLHGYEQGMVGISFVVQVCAADSLVASTYQPFPSFHRKPSFLWMWKPTSSWTSQIAELEANEMWWKDPLGTKATLGELFAMVLCPLFHRRYQHSTFRGPASTSSSGRKWQPVEGRRKRRGPGLLVALRTCCIRSRLWPHSFHCLKPIHPLIIPPTATKNLCSLQTTGI